MDDGVARRVGAVVLVVAAATAGGFVMASGGESDPSGAVRSVELPDSIPPGDDAAILSPVDVADEDATGGLPVRVDDPVRPAPPATTAPPGPTTLPPVTAPPLGDVPAVVARPIPVDPPPPAPSAPPAPWADSVRTTAGGHLSTDVGCASDRSAPGLDAFFAQSVGPVIGWDYQHVYPLGGDRFLWLFQDVFVDHSNTASTLDGASFVHNAALIQEGNCFRLLHGGTEQRPAPFESGTGTETLRTWFWPMGGEVLDGRLYVFWARMVKDAVDPRVPNGLGWHPDMTFLATYDPDTLQRLDVRPATQPFTSPIYGYAVQSDDEWTYLFGNSFEQNLTREGGWFNGPFSGTRMYLARVPRGAVFDQPTYWTSTGWTQDRRAAEPILQRHWAEFPFQPRLIDGRWVAATAVDGYWGDEFTLDVANDPWGPWTTVESGPLLPRGADPLMNTYHAHLMPWRDGAGDLVVSVSNNARDMRRHAWPSPSRYRPAVFTSPWSEPPTPSTTSPTTTTTTTMPITTTTMPIITTTTPSSSSTAPSTASTTSSTTVAE